MKIFLFGEAMLEYHSHGSDGFRYGGDTINTAVHLARAGYDVAYVTAVGMDAMSDRLVAEWSSEGIDTSHVLRHPRRTLGIYAIHLDEHGERDFRYWRDQSAARQMFDLPGIQSAIDTASAAHMLNFSLISLAIVDETGRDRLLALAAARKAGGRHVAYDSNFRPRLWPNAVVARKTSEAAIRSATIGFPTETDERRLYNDQRSDAEIATAWQKLGSEQVVVKAGERGCFLAERPGSLQHFSAPPAAVLDTTGAGDAFNAGFLAGILEGRECVDGVRSGQAMAKAALGRLGAIGPRSPAVPETGGRCESWSGQFDTD